MAAAANEQLKGALLQNPALLGAIQVPLDTCNSTRWFFGKSSGYVESLPAEVQRRLNALKNLQDQHGQLEAQFRHEIVELEKKFLALYQPLYEKRSKIVTGELEPSDEEARREDQENESAPQAKESDSKMTGVPEFWLTILKNHPQISELVTEADEGPLKALTDIRVSHLENNPGFKLDFYFGKNEHFTNSVLSKTYYLSNPTDPAIGDLVYDHAEGTTIQWNEGKDLSVTVEIKKQRHKATNKTRTVKKTVPADTFFNFFAPPSADDVEDMDDEEADELENRLEIDYEIGDIFKEKIIPHAIDWFTGKALQYEEEYDDEYDEEYDEGEDDDDEEDDEDDEEEEEGEGGAKKEQPAECKQQ